MIGTYALSAIFSRGDFLRNAAQTRIAPTGGVLSNINEAVYHFDCNAIYSSILCGFKPTDLLKPDTDIYLKDLFYIGGIKGYLKHFT